MKESDETINTYDKIARHYAEYSFPRLSQYQLMQFSSLLLTGNKVLDVGCGSGRDTQFLRDEGHEVIGIDASSGMIEEAKRLVGGDFRLMDMKKLDFSENSIDGLWCCASLLHQPKNNLSSTLREFHRVLKNGGVAYIALKEGIGEMVIRTPNALNEPRFFAFYSQEEIAKALKIEGFNIISSESEIIEGVRWLNIFARKGSSIMNNDESDE